jgi:hypothetical protein
MNIDMAFTKHHRDYSEVYFTHNAPRVWLVPESIEKYQEMLQQYQDDPSKAHITKLIREQIQIAEDIMAIRAKYKEDDPYYY